MPDPDYLKFLLGVESQSPGLIPGFQAPEWLQVGEGLIVPWPAATVEEWLARHGVRSTSGIDRRE